MARARIYRWNGALVGMLALVVVGLITQSVVAILASVIPLGYLLLGALNRLPESPQLSIERQISDSNPTPGSTVTVQLQIENEGDAPLSDVRIIDVVPDELPVVEGTPRGAFSLRPGTSNTVEYSIVTRRGTYKFGEPYLRLRSLAGTDRLTDRLSITGDAAIECVIHGADIEPQQGTLLRTGPVSSDRPGRGIDFHSKRKYRTGDKLSRVDWRHYAKTGDMTTIEFREQNSSKILLVVDARNANYVTPFSGHPTGTELSIYAATRTFDTLVSAGHQVGLTTVGVNAEDLDVPVHTDRSGAPWVNPGAGDETTTRIRAVLDGILENIDERSSNHNQHRERTAEPVSADGGSDIAETLDKQLATSTEVMIFSSALDDFFVDLVGDLRVVGHDVSVVSPNLVYGTDRTTTILDVERGIRLDTVRGLGAMVVDWNPDDPFHVTLENQFSNLL